MSFPSEKKKVAVRIGRDDGIPKDLDAVVAGLRGARLDWRKRQGKREQDARELPSPDALRHAMRDLCSALFPMRLGPHDLNDVSVDYYVGRTLAESLGIIERQIALELSAGGALNASSVAREKTGSFGAALPAIRRALDNDVEAAHQGDPAARSVDEVLLCYPGTLAIIYYRLAHSLFGLGLPLIARIVAEIAHSETGIDIHPGAQIGSGFFIDHGTGVVIGETTVIGNRVRLYQAVTLGAKSFPKEEDGSLRKGLRRHPTVEDDVVIYAGATVLGRVTIGAGAVIGGNVWLTHSVPAGAVITQAGVLEEGKTEGG
jgi:serine O-acetyltransferase